MKIKAGGFSHEWVYDSDTEQWIRNGVPRDGEPFGKVLAWFMISESVEYLDVIGEESQPKD